MENTNKIAHLNMIQGCVNRMASNSSMLKGLSVTILVAVFALIDETQWYLLTVISIIPFLMFSGLDAWYLRFERIYRNMYNKTLAVEDDAEITFDLTPSSDFQSEKTAYCKCYFSKSILCFYLPLLVLCALAIFLKTI